MRQIAHCQINNFSFEFTNPERAAWLMRDFLNKTVKKTNQTLTKNLLTKLRKLKVGLKEVEEIAGHLLDQHKVKVKVERTNIE